MPERQTLTQLVQIGVEVTPGTTVAATKVLAAMAVEPGLKVDVKKFRPTGTKWPTLAPIGKEWTEAKLSGKATFTELVYPLSSLLGAATITTPGGGTASRDWTWTPSSTAPITPVTFTVEQGDSVRAHEFGYGLVTAMGFKFSRDEVEFDGQMIGQALSDGSSLTGALSPVALVPVLGKQLDVYLDDTAAGLGGTKLLRVFNNDVTIGDRYMPFWPINSALPSFGGHTESEPSGQVKMLVAADAAGMGMLTAVRAGASKFLRVEALGAVIEAAITYKARFDLALKVTDVTEFKDSEGIYALEWTFDIVHDATWGKAISIVLTNALTAL